VKKNMRNFHFFSRKDMHNLDGGKDKKTTPAKSQRRKVEGSRGGGGGRGAWRTFYEKGETRSRSRTRGKNIRVGLNPATWRDRRKEVKKNGRVRRVDNTQFRLIKA